MVAARLRAERALEKMVVAEVEAALRRMRGALGDGAYDKALAALAGPDPESGEGEREK